MCHRSKMDKPKSNKYEYYWHAFFEFGVLVKGLNGLWETIGGILVLFLSEKTFFRLFYKLAQNELLEDPNDIILNSIASALQSISADTKTFAALYILAHGLLNIFLAIQLYRDRLWAYRVAIVAMIVFMTYQIYRIILFHSVTLTIITLYDVIFILLTLHEYRYRKSLGSNEALLEISSKTLGKM